MDNQKLLVCLDTVLDTRLATIGRVDPDLAVEIFENSFYTKKYFERSIDNFSLIKSSFDHELYKQAYKDRDIETLMSSIMTTIVQVISELTDNWRKAQRKLSLSNDIELCLNTYPYQISNEEIDDILVAITSYCPNIDTVSSVCISPSELTPQKLKEEYSTWITYDLDSWIVSNSENIKDKPIPTFPIICPMISYQDQLPLEKDLHREGNNILDPFTALKTIMTEWVIVDYLPAETFSIIRIK